MSRFSSSCLSWLSLAHLLTTVTHMWLTPTWPRSAEMNLSTFYFQSLLLFFCCYSCFASAAAANSKMTNFVSGSHFKVFSLLKFDSSIFSLSCLSWEAFKFHLIRLWITQICLVGLESAVATKIPIFWPAFKLLCDSTLIVMPTSDCYY